MVTFLTCLNQHFGSFFFFFQKHNIYLIKWDNTLMSYVHKHWLTYTKVYERNLTKNFTWWIGIRDIDKGNYFISLLQCLFSGEIVANCSRHTHVQAMKVLQQEKDLTHMLLAIILPLITKCRTEYFWSGGV